MCTELLRRADDAEHRGRVHRLLDAVLRRSSDPHLDRVPVWTEYRFIIAESVYASVETLALFNSAINPVLYGCFNVHLKRGLVEVCCPRHVRQQV